MEITYFGLNAVRLRGRDATVMIDPYEPKLGLSPVRLNIQIVIFTHEDPTHFSLQGLAGDPHIVTVAGEFEIKAVATHNVIFAGVVGVRLGSAGSALVYHERAYKHV